MAGAGVHGILPHHARQLSDAAASICKCFKSTLEAHPMSYDKQPPLKRVRLTAHSSSLSEQQQPAQADSSTQQQQQQQKTTQLQSDAEAQLAHKQMGAKSEQQQQQLPEQLLQQLTQHQHFPLQLLDQVKHLQQHGQQLLPQHQQQRDQQQQTQSPGQPGAQPHASHSPVFESHNIGGASCLLHVTPSQDTANMPTAGKEDSTDVQQQQQQAYDAHQASHAQGRCREEDLPPEQHETAAAADGRQAAEGVWQVLLQAAVAHDEELWQEVIQQCKEEEMDVPQELKLASRGQFEELALLADLSLSNLPLAGDYQASVDTCLRGFLAGLSEKLMLMVHVSLRILSVAADHEASIST